MPFRSYNQRREQEIQRENDNYFMKVVYPSAIAVGLIIIGCCIHNDMNENKNSERIYYPLTNHITNNLERRVK